MRPFSLGEVACGALVSGLSLLLGPALADRAADLASGLPAAALLAIGFLLSRSVATLLWASARLVLPRPHDRGRRVLATGAGSGGPKASIGNRR